MPAISDNLAVCFFTSARDNQPMQDSLTWDDLSALLMRHEERGQKDGRLWSPTLYRPGTKRGKANVEQVSCLVLDFDHEANPMLFTRGWEPWAYVMHTTFQHTEAEPRWRVVFPLLKPIPGEDWPSAWESLARRFGGNVVDTSCRDASRIYYLPACPPGAVREAWGNEGKRLNAEAFLRPSVEVLISRARGELHTGRNNAGMWLACQMRDNGYTQAETERARWHQEVPQEKRDPAGRVDLYTEDEWQETVRKAFGRGKREPWKPGAVNGNGVHSTPADPSVVSVVPFLSSHAPPPTELEPEALYGLPGQVVLTIEPHTESGQSAILASFIIGIGCFLGRGPHVYRDGARHAGNEFACLVGLSSAGRKGTASRRIDEVFKCLYDSKYTKLTTHDMRDRQPAYADLTITGLGSGEALIETLADEDEDRRRVVFESEFAKVIKVMRREGSTLSDTLRAAWDGDVLANRTKGKQLKAVDTHVSILGHITNTELRSVLSATEVFNGFANRFLWFFTERSKLLPFGGGDPPIAAIVKTIYEMLQFASGVGRVDFDEECCRLWDAGGIYKLLTERPETLWGAVTSRAAPHVLRLALIYAVTDFERVIRVPHLLAALAVWDYNERSCEHIFGRSTGNDAADTIEELLREAYPGFLTRKEIRDAFSRNAKPGVIPEGLQVLQDQGKARMVSVPTDGRHAEAWVATEQKLHDRYDRSPLKLARELIERWHLGNE